MLTSVLRFGMEGRVDRMPPRAKGRLDLRRALASLMRRVTCPGVSRAPTLEQPSAGTGGVTEEDLLDEMAIW